MAKFVRVELPGELEICLLVCVVCVFLWMAVQLCASMPSFPFLPFI